MATRRYKPRRKFPNVKTVEHEVQDSSRFLPSSPSFRRRFSSPSSPSFRRRFSSPISPHYLARTAPRRDYYDKQDSILANDAHDTEKLTLSQRILSCQTSITDDDDRYVDLDSHCDRLVVDDEPYVSCDTDVDHSDDMEDDIDVDDDENTDRVSRDADTDEDNKDVADDQNAISRKVTPDTTNFNTSNNSHYASDSNNGHLQPNNLRDSPANDEDVGRDVEDVGRDEDKSDVPTHHSQTPEDGATSSKKDNSKLKEFEQALDEAVADDDHFLQMVREDRTRLSRDTKDWTDEYSLDGGNISSMAEKLMEGNLQHLYGDLPPQQRKEVEETLSRMHNMSLQEIMDSIAASD